jgi:multimeric flavodoxin WrbA
MIMKAILLDGSTENDRTGERVRAALMAEFQLRGWEVEHFALCEQKIGNCAGDFFCWIRTPGVCNVNDDNRRIAEALVTSDLLVYLTPITFGGYAATLKRMVDHQIQNVSPFFTMIEGETHHLKRYKRNPDFLAVGWMTTPDTQSEAIFRHLVQRNAINFHTQTHVSGVIFAGQSDGEIQTSAQKWLDDLQDGRSSARVDLPISRTANRGAVEVRRAVLLIGSPKTRKSTSNSLGAYLFEQLSAQSIQTETIYLHTVLRNPQKMQALLDALDAADLVTLAFPLYVDSLPAPVVEALERISTHRKGQNRPRRQLFSAIANCGFPEAFQCNTALTNCELFARQTGFSWAGGLALGAGHMLNGVPLVEGGGMTMHMRQALDLAAKALAQGQAIPQAARDGLAKPVIPHWVYRLSGWWRWHQQAKANGARKLLKHQPYLVNVK